jgi:hypothetical protein
MIEENGLVAGELGNLSKNENPFSHEYIIFGSMGSLPKYGTPNKLAIFSGVFISLFETLSTISVPFFGVCVGGVNRGASRNKASNSGQRDLILCKKGKICKISYYNKNK